MQKNSNLLGLHILLSLKTKETEKLKNKSGFLTFLKDILDQYSLIKVGESTHTFENDSFTAAVCLMESHICIHTWPEIQQLTADVYLCNYSTDNSEVVKKISSDIVAYFNAEIVKKTEIYR